MQQHPTHKSVEGFTLIEMLIVIAIIGILASVAIPQFNQYKIRAYDAHSKQALKDMHLLCNAYWLDTDTLQGCDLPIIKDTYYGFNQNADVVATLPPSPLDNFCASAKHNDSPNTYSIDSAAMISSTGDCGKEQAEIQLAAAKKAELESKYGNCENDGGTFIPIEFFQAAGSIYGDTEYEYIRNSNTPVLGFCAGNRSDRRPGFDIKMAGCEGNKFQCGTDVMDRHPNSNCSEEDRQKIGQERSNFCGASINQVALVAIKKGLEYQSILSSEGKENAEIYKQNEVKKSCLLKAKATERLINSSYDRCCASNTFYSGVVNGKPVIECRVEFCLDAKQRNLTRYIQGDHPMMASDQRLQSICLEQDDVKSIINNL